MEQGILLLLGGGGARLGAGDGRDRLHPARGGPAVLHRRRVSACGTSSAAPPGSRTPSMFGVLPLLVASLWIAGIAARRRDPARPRARRSTSPSTRPSACAARSSRSSSCSPACRRSCSASSPSTRSCRRSRTSGVIKENQLFSALGAGIVVGLLITPLISSLSEDAMRAVPSSMREGAYGVGRHQARRGDADRAPRGPLGRHGRRSSSASRARSARPWPSRWRRARSRS